MSISAHNKKNSAVKRIMQEAAELAADTNSDFSAAPLESNIFEWHATIRIPSEDGIFHVRIILPSEYPFKAPDLVLLTPNGRFEVGKKLCIAGVTSFHADQWQPAWGVRSALIGLSSFWLEKGQALSAIGALDYPADERRRLAKLSKEWICPVCQQSNRELLPERSAVEQPLEQSSSQASAEIITAPSSPTIRTSETRSTAMNEAHSDADQMIGRSQSSVVEPSASEPTSPPVGQIPPGPGSPRVRQQLVGSTSAAPVWFDALFVILIASLGILLARRLV